MIEVPKSRGPEVPGSHVDGSVSPYGCSSRLGVAALEALYGLRDRAKRYRVLGPYRVARMVREVYERSADIVEEETVDWIGALRARGDTITVSRSEALRLIAVARDVDVVGREEWIDLT